MPRRFLELLQKMITLTNNTRKVRNMNSSNAHFTAGVCSLLIAVLIIALGIVERQTIAGLVGALVMIVIGVALLRKGEQIVIDESINRRLFKSNFN